MLKKTITFEDLDGNEVVEDFYFNLSKAELAEMELSYEGGLSARLKSIIQAEKPDGALIIRTFSDLISKTVGKRSEDGRRFIKNQEITDAFVQSNAYSEFFMELVTDAKASAEFVRAVMPSSIQEGLDSTAQPIQDIPLLKEAAPPEPHIPETNVQAWKREKRRPTNKELQTMSPDELREAFRARNDE